MQTHTHTKKNQSWAHNFEKSWETNFRETTSRTSVQLSPKHQTHAGQKKLLGVSQGDASLVCSGLPVIVSSKVFQSDFSLEDGSWQTTTTGTNTWGFLRYPGLGFISFIQDGFANHLIISLGAAPGSKYFCKKVWLQHIFWHLASGLTLT